MNAYIKNAKWGTQTHNKFGFEKFISSILSNVEKFGKIEQ